MKTKLYSTLVGSRKPFITFLAAILFLTVRTQAQTFHIFDHATDFPSGGVGGVDANVVDIPVELGLKFRVTQGGTLDSIWFYKGTSNTGTHVGSIWDNTGALLGSVIFTGETASDWQKMKLATPVVLNPGITYTVSYWGSAGIYAASSGGINNVDQATGPFIVIGNSTSAADPGGVGAGNGVYNYSATAANTRPTNSVGDASNYWVDMSFTTFFPLPVGLVDFNANAGTSDISLTWKTESEHNNRGFQIQRSNNGADWYNLNFVTGSGESSTTRNYTYSDKGLAPGLYYYRLKQEDFDGNSKFSSVVTGRISGKGLVSLFPANPNPVHGISQIRFDLPATQKVKLSVFDVNGREVRVLLNGQQEPGSHIAPIDAAGLSKQLYYVRLQTETSVLTTKIIVQ